MKYYRNVIKNSLQRLLVLYLPFIGAFVFLNPTSLTGDAYSPFGIFKKVLEGNWHLILAPFSGMGYSFITDDYLWKIFGLILSDSFRNYLNFILGGPTVVLGFITAVISWSLILRNKSLFFIPTTILNFVAQILFFFIASYHLWIPSNINYDFSNLYSVIFGGFILIVGFVAFLLWLRENDKDRLLVPLWMGSAFLFIFTFLTWAFAPVGTGFSSTSYYLVVASIGSSLVAATFLAAIYDKIKHSRMKILAPFVFLILILIFAMSSSEILIRYSSLNKDGRGAKGQIIMQEEARRVLTNYKEGDSALFYFDTSDIIGNGPFYSEGFLTSFPFFMLLQQDKVVDGCIGIIYEDNKMPVLKNSIQIQNEVKGFNHSTMCVKNKKLNMVTLFFTPDNFYALKIKDKKLIDIKVDVLKRLNF